MHTYGKLKTMGYYYNEESTKFLPSKDGEKIYLLIYNGSRTDEKDQIDQCQR